MPSVADSLGSRSPSSVGLRGPGRRATTCAIAVVFALGCREGPPAPTAPPDSGDPGPPAVFPDGLYWSARDGGRVQHLRPDDGQVSTVLSGLSDPRGLVVTANEVYLIDAGTEVLLREPADGSPQQILTTTQGPGDLQRDGDDLVFTDRDQGAIRRWTSAGTATDIVTGVFEPYFLDVSDGFVWWADFDSSQLHRVPLSGGPIEDFDVDARWLRDLVVTEDYVTWSDRETGRIQRAPLPDLQPTEDLYVGMRTPHGLIQVDDDLYWTDTTTGQIHRGPASGGVSSVVADGLQGPWALSWLDGAR